jgi:hypothetical protein
MSKTERYAHPQGRSVREPGDTIPLSPKKAEEAAATARSGTKRAFRFDLDWIAFWEVRTVELGFPADRFVPNAAPGLGALGEDLSNGAFGAALEVVGCHLGREEAEQR